MCVFKWHNIYLIPIKFPEKKKVKFLNFWKIQYNVDNLLSYEQRTKKMKKIHFRTFNSSLFIFLLFWIKSSPNFRLCSSEDDPQFPRKISYQIGKMFLVW